MRALAMPADTVIIVVLLSLFFGVSLWWTPNLRDAAQSLVQERRYGKLALITLLSSVVFFAIMRGVALILI
jgi:hypothetical protein